MLISLPNLQNKNTTLWDAMEVEAREFLIRLPYFADNIFALAELLFNFVEQMKGAIFGAFDQIGNQIALFFFIFLCVSILRSLQISC